MAVRHVNAVRCKIRSARLNDHVLVKPVRIRTSLAVASEAELLNEPAGRVMLIGAPPYANCDGMFEGCGRGLL